MHETDEVAKAAARMIRAVGERVGSEDPSQLAWVLHLRVMVDEAQSIAIMGLRELGYTDAQIGESLGMTRQAVNKRWPGGRRIVGAGARYQTRP